MTDDGGDVGDGACAPAGRTAAPRGGLRAVLGIRDFRLFWAGETVSLVGDQFYLIALPWLVLLLTGDAVALATVLALAAVPRAAFMLVGGAMTDRLSPRTVMILSNAARAALVSALAALVLTGAVEMWMVYALALGFGLADAFFYPAQMAIVPRLVGRDHLHVANSLVQGMMSVSLFAGPVVAGLVVAAFAGAGGDLAGIGLALAVDALTFVVSLATLGMMGTGASNRGEGAGAGSTLSAIREGFAYVWGSAALRLLIGLCFAVNFLLVGPIAVGIPFLASTRLAGGAVAFGTVMTAFGGGMLVGIVMAAGLPRPAAGRLGPVLGSSVCAIGVGVASLAVLPATWTVALATLAIGVANGYVNVMLVTWLQARTEEAMMGRTMSLIMFASMGIAPVSHVLAGVLVGLNGPLMFAGMGTALVVVMLAAMLSPHVRGIAFQPDARAEAAA